MDEAIIILSSTWKFAATFPVAVYGFNMSFLQTVLFTNIGGVLGIVVFGILAKSLLVLYRRFWPQKLKFQRKKKRTFSKRNRRLVRFKKKYGLPGIVVLTPVLLSIPVGTFLIVKYYGKQKQNYVYLFLCQLAWSILYTLFYLKMKVFL